MQSIPYGKYLLQHKLTEGGMAEIFLARQVGLEGFERPVVVKRLLPQHSAESEFIKMFLNEARLAARLNHPNIVQIFELGQEQDTYYISMEYIRGEDLRGLAETADRRQHRPPLGMVCRIIIDALAGLHYAHTRPGVDGRPLGLVHRDISPQNILVTYDGRVKVIDFGIAKATQQRSTEQTQAGLLKGKYAYMSPEQTRGDKLDARSDVFAAGILLWELVTWRRLFKRSTDLATLVAVSDEPAPPMSMINPESPPELDQVVLKALAVEPEDRYSSAQAFAEALEDCVALLGWDADNRQLGHFMRDLFRDKLDRQLQRAREAGYGSVEEYLLSGKAGDYAPPQRPPLDAGGELDDELDERRELPLPDLQLKVESRSQKAMGYRPPSPASPTPDAATVVSSSPLSPGATSGRSTPRPLSPTARTPSTPAPSPLRPSTGVTPAVAPLASPTAPQPMVMMPPPQAPYPVALHSGPTPAPATMQSIETAGQRRVIIAVVVGLLCGVLVVALLSLLS